MRPGIIALIAIVAIAGCASPKDVTTAKLRFSAGTNEIFSIDQPKDTMFTRAEYRKPDGTTLIIEGYQSTGNAAAIEAVRSQAKAQADVSIRAMELIKDAAMKAAPAAGPAASLPATRSMQDPPVWAPMRGDSVPTPSSSTAIK